MHVYVITMAISNRGIKESDRIVACFFNKNKALDLFEDLTDKTFVGLYSFSEIEVIK